MPGDRHPPGPPPPCGLRLALVFVLLLYCDGAAPKPAQLTDLKHQRFIIDVDPGCDDAMALLLMLGAEKHGADKGISDEVPKTEVITCVYGNTNLSNVVFNTFRVLDVANRLDIPVYAGAVESLVSTPPMDNYFGLDGFGNIGGDRTKYDGKLQEEHAVHALIRKVTESPGELTLLCLGPLTNIALAERLHKGFVSKLRRLIVMGGSVEGYGNVKPAVEFNNYMDPESFQVVLDAAAQAGQPLLLVPWETVILRVKLPLEWRYKVLGAVDSPGIALMNRAEKKFLDRLDGDRGEEEQELLWAPADVVTAAVALDAGLATHVSKPLHVGVALGKGPARATCHVDYINVTGRAPNAQIVKHVDVDRLKAMILSYVT